MPGFVAARCLRWLSALGCFTFTCVGTGSDGPAGRNAADAATAVDDGGTLRGRHAHWVLRTSDLERSLEFYDRVFGLRVLRHEEHEEACPITCNGRFGPAWSKTMVGHQTEDRAYALELTYNYGVTSYVVGDALRTIGLRPRRPMSEALLGAAELGYGPPERRADGVLSLVGPDDYVYELLPQEPAAKLSPDDEPFAHVRIRVQNLAKSFDFYTRMLGMSELAKTDTVRVVGYPDSPLGEGTVSSASVPLQVEASPEGAPVRVEQWEGRHAVSLPAADLRRAYARIKREFPAYVVHELRELEEALGTLLIAIVRDPDGLELCLVSSEVFDPAVLAAADFKHPNWDARRALISEGQAAASASDAGKPVWAKPTHGNEL